MIQRTLQAIFCDDIRHEVNGKQTLVGVYSGGLYVQDFPAVVPALSIFVRFITSSRFTPATLKVRVVKGDQAVHEFVVPELDLQRFRDTASSVSSASPEGDIQTMQFMLGLNQLPFEGDTVLRVEAITDDGTYVSAPLAIGKLPVQGAAARD